MTAHDLDSESATSPTTVRALHLDIPPALRDVVRALVAVDVQAAGPIPLAITPHDSLMLTVQLGRGADADQAKADAGHNTRLTGIRHWTGAFQAGGDCVSLFALLTPLGFVRLLDSRPLDAAPRIRASVAELLDRSLTRALEADIAQAATLPDKLGRFAAWLEARASTQRRYSAPALRAGRAAMRLCEAPNTAIETLAADERVSRRQLERDFARWLGTSPRHLAQVVRVQAVSRQAQRGAALADIASDVGFADQAHMSNVVRQLTGLTPSRFARPSGSAIGAAFRRATGGGTVYL